MTCNREYLRRRSIRLKEYDYSQPVGAIHESPLQQRRKMLLPKIIGYYKMNTAKQKYIAQNPLQWHIDEENPDANEAIDVIYNRLSQRQEIL